MIITEEYMVPTTDNGIQLYLRNKHSANLKTFSEEKTLLYVHGSTFPAESTFDLRLNNLSWMEYIANRGYDVYLVDVRGYGKSSRPAEMDFPAKNNPPLVRTETAVSDVSTAVDFILKRKSLSKINLLGWSWGTSIVAWYTSLNNAKVNKLALYAPRWIGNVPSLIDHAGQLDAYRTLTPETALAPWLRETNGEIKNKLVPPGWREACIDATFNTDPIGSKQTPRFLRVPNGTLQDTREYWQVEKALYDPNKIIVPTLLVHGEWDLQMPSSLLYAYFAQLTNAQYRRCIQIGEATHYLLMEKNRMQLFYAVQQFFDEEFIPGH